MLRTLTLGLLFALCLTAFASADDEPDAKSLTIGDKAPDIDIAHAFIDSRMGTDAQKSGNDETKNRFRMWFNYHPDNPQSGSGGAKNVAHLHELNQQVERRDRKTKQLTATFFKGSYYSFTVR